MTYFMEMRTQCKIITDNYCNIYCGNTIKQKWFSERAEKQSNGHPQENIGFVHARVAEEHKMYISLRLQHVRLSQTITRHILLKDLALKAFEVWIMNSKWMYLSIGEIETSSSKNGYVTKLKVSYFFPKFNMLESLLVLYNYTKLWNFIFFRMWLLRVFSSSQWTQWCISSYNNELIS